MIRAAQVLCFALGVGHDSGGMVPADVKEPAQDAVVAANNVKSVRRQSGKSGIDLARALVPRDQTICQDWEKTDRFSNSNTRVSMYQEEGGVEASARGRLGLYLAIISLRPVSMSSGAFG